MKNPILAFRKLSTSNEQYKGSFKDYDLKKGINNNPVINFNKEYTATLITKTREAVDMSESS